MEVDTVEKEVSTGIDVEAVSDSISDQMFPDAPETPDIQEGLVAAPDASSPTELAPAAVVADPAPKSWPKEMHEHWGKTPKEVQTYWQTREKQMLEGLDQYKGAAQYGKALNDVLSPYHSLLQSKGLDAPRAVADMMQAYTALTQGTPDQRSEAYARIGKNLGITSTQAGEPVQIDPHVKALQDQFNQMQSVLTAQQEATYTAAKGKAMQEVEAFASNPANVHFNDLQDDILRELQAGHDLPTAYKRAVRANDVTYEKELARIRTETEATLKENARLQSLPKKQARSVNISGRDTFRAPTEPLGSIDEEMKKGLAAIRSRTAH